ncbi:3-deoxy-D-manno-octulosonic acid transferase [Sulfurimonas lithotrophica]|uniref:3-deoxy-D-manno-octulosonic acid transferase n=1 Tax=Sulfurimonas lithotrophica TaxID=2590022 RepID=A0A5P8NZ67_9BACT|nr:lipid IV(A) 3-deoxy-D-manno-octulosonic acid transferase [Sulfurimonas lithotrophica]QFR48745.1 3-deoxy-D-manno-octulosonic acid transferase [Sulfurimonas lithotrophica]
MWKLQSNKALPFSVFYFILSVVLYIVALPLLILLSLKPKYKQSIPARFFLYKNKRFSSEDGIWFHVCSLGEARALKPIIDCLDGEDIKITTITHTGQAEAKKYDAEVRYLPYEMFLPFWAKKQRVVVVLEAEFWYMLFAVAASMGSRVILLNARISERSAQRYLQFAWFYEKLLSNVEMIYAQSEADKNRFLALGARNIEVVGNIKLAAEIKKTKDFDKPHEEVIVAGSTHLGEEQSILDSYVSYKETNDSKLIVVPRHPERFESVYLLMEAYAKEYNLSLSRFSEEKNFFADMILVDAMGELNNIYNISDVVILGGAFREDVGGHNPLEPAFFGCKIITGKHFFHQKELFKYVHHVQYVDADGIKEALDNAKELPPSIVEEKIDLDRVIDKLKK